MAKTRVYELARDLNLTNKILLSKLSDLGISVKSHISSLDDESVCKLKQAHSLRSPSKILADSRVKPTVIRRRRKNCVKRLW